ncbi:MAG: dTDP-glucose 4,6-dehydratase [Planctomycetota bacterium]|nr:dTDP-glucose 4,6-dehydratase [Planctomycetota bacterium]
MARLLVTGGAGFIGSNYIRYVLESEPADDVVCLDALTYAGNRANLEGLEETGRMRFLEGDIRDPQAVRAALDGVTEVVHFAAESHVDRSIVSATEFLSTNVTGTHLLLLEAQTAGVERFVHIGTDEVYGSIEAPRKAGETDPLLPSNPYSASKAAGDHLALAHHNTYGLAVCVTRCGNNYGPYQFPEKLLPLAILRALQDRPIPVYGDGLQVRDWVHVRDHCRAVHLVLKQGRPGEIYNIGGRDGTPNLEVLRAVLAALGKPESLLQHVQDRPGHDRRYAVDSSKIREQLGFEPEVAFEEGLRQAVLWYRDHEAWWRPVLERSERERKHWLEEEA